MLGSSVVSKRRLVRLIVNVYSLLIVLATWSIQNLGWLCGHTSPVVVDSCSSLLLSNIEVVAPVLILHLLNFNFKCLSSDEAVLHGIVNVVSVEVMLSDLGRYLRFFIVVEGVKVVSLRDLGVRLLGYDAKLCFCWLLI